MRIAIFADTYPPTINGVARTLGRLVEHVAARGHDVFLAGPRVGAAVETRATYHHRAPGVPLPVYPELQILRFLDRAGKRALEAFAPDLVHVATEAPLGWSGRQWALRAGVPLVTSFHTNMPEYLAGYGFGRLEGALWRGFRAFHRPARLTFCPSSATLTELRTRGFHDRLRIWPRGVDADRFSPVRRSEALREQLAPGAEHVMVYVGRLAPEKRLDVLLDAWPLVRAALGERVALVLVGDGPLAPTLRATAPAGVSFTGYRTGVELAEAYAIGDVFVFPSDTETFGNVVAEALASGLPVVAPARGGVTDLVQPDVTGVLVPPRDAAAFATACIDLLRDPLRRLRLAHGARRLALGLDWAVILDGLLGHYEEACDPERPAPSSTEIHPLLGVL